MTKKNKKLEVNQARDEIDKAIDTYLTRIDQLDTPEHALIKSDTGLGKSVRMRAALPAWIAARKAAGKPHRVIWAVPFHRLSDEALVGFQGLQIKAMVWRGREASNPHAALPGTSMCTNLDIVKEVQNAMGDVAKMVCGKENGPQCPFRKNCAYLAQRDAVTKADVVIVAHELLFNPKSLGDLGGYGLVVIDESFYACGLPVYDEDGIPLSAEIRTDSMITHTDHMPPPKKEDHTKLNYAIKKLKKILVGMKHQEYITGSKVRKITSVDFAEIYKIEWSRKITPDIQPGMTIEDIRIQTKKAAGNRDVAKRAALWKVLARLQAGEPIDSYLMVKIKENDTGKSTRIRMNALKQMNEKILALPILYLDATPTLNIAKAFMPELKLIADVEATTPHMHVLQVMGIYGKAMIPADNDVAKVAKEKASRINRFKSYISAFPGKKLVITYQDFEDYFDGLEDVQTAHFNALAGLDCFGDVDHLFLIGRAFAASDAVHMMAECYSGQIIRYENPADQIVDIEMSDGSSQQIIVKDYSEEILRSVKYAVTDASNIQGVGRARGVNRTESNPVTVHHFADVALPHAVDHVVAQKDLFQSTAKTPAQRKRRERDMKKIAQLTDELTDLNQKIRKNVTKSHIVDSIWQNVTKTEILESDIPVEIQVNLYDDIYTPVAWTSDSTLEHPEFIEFLKERSEANYKHKDDNQLISPAIFDPGKEADGKKRGLGNIDYLNGVWLDNDDGDLSIADFIALFPEWQMYIFNSFSSGKINEDGKAGKKWRCYIPVSHYLTPAAYKHIIKILMKRLADNGYHQKGEKRHGFDASKFPASSLFYLPCQSGYGDSFFSEYLTDRVIFNPFTVIRGNDVEEEEEIIVKPVIAPPPTMQVSPKASEALRKLQEKHIAEQQAKQTAKQKNQINHAYHACIDHRKGEGNMALFKFASRLRELEVDQFEAKAEMEYAASNMISPAERRNEISALIRKFWGC